MTSKRHCPLGIFWEEVAIYQVEFYPLGIIFFKEIAVYQVEFYPLGIIFFLKKLPYTKWSFIHLVYFF